MNFLTLEQGLPMQSPVTLEVRQQPPGLLTALQLPDPQVWGTLPGALLGVCLCALGPPTHNSHSSRALHASPAACCSELISLQMSHGPARVQWECHSFLGHPQLCAPLGSDKVPICLRIPKPSAQPTDAGRFLLKWAGMRRLLTPQEGLETRRHPPSPHLNCCTIFLSKSALILAAPRPLAGSGTTCLSMAGICLCCSHCPA